MVYRFLLFICFALLLPLISYASQEYTVKKGDNLYDLSRKFDVSIKELKEENGLRNNNLTVGDKLIIPGPGNETKVSANSSAGGTYVVKSGDTLGHIAENYGVTSKTIKKLNGLKGDSLSIGQKLQVPSVTETKSQTKEVKEDNVKPLPSTYVVKKGDFPGKIAESLGVSTKELIELNNLNSKSLQIGQELKVPGADGITTSVEQGTDETKVPEIKAQKEIDTEITVKNKTEDSPSTPDSKTATEKPKVSTPEVYVVKKGDTPSEIAEKLGVSTKDLVSANNLNSKSIQIGQKLKVPNTSTVTKAKTPAKEQSVEKTPSVPDVYEVKKGDSLYVISKKFGVPVSEIKKKNNLRGNNLRIGQKLTLGAKQASDAAPVVKSEKEDQSETLRKQKETGKYTVRKGDTVSQIALKFEISQKELKSLNGLRSNTLRIGQVLKVPKKSENDATSVVKSSNVQDSKVVKSEPEKKQAAYVKKRYVVKSGDTLSGIADNFNVSIKELKKASALKNDKISKGDVLLIPVPHDYVATPKRASASPNYTVVTGDTLGGIASKYGVTVSDLKTVNGLTNNELWVGMKLEIPGKGTQLQAETTPNPAPAIRKEYRVKRGDTLGVIAKRHGVKVTDLKKENNLRTSTIRVGQTLRIPGTANYLHSYSAESDNAYESNGYAANGHSKNGYYSNTEISPKYNIIKVAKKYLGAPYKFGGNSYKTGIDCSGYVKKVFSSFNVDLPRTARDIYYRSGHKIAKSQLDTGDLVFFQTYAKYPSHVGIYIGDDQFIHASSARKKVSIDNMNKRYYRNRYIGAKRVQVSSLFYDEYSKEFEDR